MEEIQSRQKLVNSVNNSERAILASQYRAKLYPLILSLYETHTLQEICRELNETIWIVTQTVKEYGIKTRKRGQSPDGTHKGNVGEQTNRKGYGQKNHTTRSRAVYVENYGELPDNWEVHHINGNKTDNNLDNLVALPKSKHMSLHCFDRHGNKEGVTTILTEYLQVKGNTSHPSYG
jgi:hypothetical protein